MRATRRGATAVVTAVVLALLLAAGCGSGARTAPSGEGGATADGGAGSTVGDVVGTLPAPIVTDVVPHLPVTVPSADGTEVTITDVSRIVPLWGSLSELVFALGLGDHVIGRDSSATFGEVADLPLVTTGHDISAESVLSLRPTLVLAHEDAGPPEALDQLRAAGVPVLVVETPTSVDAIGARMRTLGTALGVPDAGAELAAATDAELAAVQRTVPAGVAAPRVGFLYVRGGAGVYLLGGPGSGADSMIAAAGGSDAGTAIGLDEAFTPLTSEALVAAAPDVLLVTTSGLASVGGVDGLLELAGVAQTPAGQARRIVAVEDALLYSFGARTPEALATLIAELHPS